MKILIIHTYYQLRGGEDVNVEHESKLLKEENEVEVLIFHNRGGIKGAMSFFLSIWNVFAARKVKEKIASFCPDIIHIHNTHFACGPYIIRTARKAGIPIVVTLQNYRLLCPSATLLKDGKIFTDSLKASFPWKAIRYKLYRRSYIQTFWLAFIVWFHEKAGTWKMVDRYIAPTDIVRNLYMQKPFFNKLNERFVVKPNCVITTETKAEIQKSNYYLFVGRLSEEKGIYTLLKAFEHSGCELIIAGEGPLKGDVVKKSELYKNIRYVGMKNKQEIQSLMNQCKAFLFSSVWYEPFGLVIVEAFSNGCAIIGSDIGSPVELVQQGINGFHFKSGDAESLKAEIDKWECLPEGERNKIRSNALFTYNSMYSPGKNKAQLINIYSDSIDERKIS